MCICTSSIVSVSGLDEFFLEGWGGGRGGRGGEGGGGFTPQGLTVHPDLASELSWHKNLKLI